MKPQHEICYALRMSSFTLYSKLWSFLATPRRIHRFPILPLGRIIPMNLLLLQNIYIVHPIQQHPTNNPLMYKHHNLYWYLILHVGYNLQIFFMCAVQLIHQIEHIDVIAKKHNIKYIVFVLVYSNSKLWLYFNSSTKNLPFFVFVAMNNTLHRYI